MTFFTPATVPSRKKTMSSQGFAPSSQSSPQPIAPPRMIAATNSPPA